MIWAELVRRTEKPSREFVYWGFFLVFVAVLGGLAIWVEVVQYLRTSVDVRDPSNIYTALVTFFPAVIAASCAQMMMEAQNRRLHMFSLATLVFSTIGGILLIVAPRPAATPLWFVAVALSLAALWVWWIANADNRSLHDEPDAAVGGDPNAPLAGDVTMKL
jgi:uncharacterized protein YacL